MTKQKLGESATSMTGFCVWRTQGLRSRGLASGDMKIPMLSWKKRISSRFVTLKNGLPLTTTIRKSDYLQDQSSSLQSFPEYSEFDIHSSSPE